MKVKRNNIDRRFKQSIDEMRFIINFLSYMPYLSSLNLIDMFEENIISFKEQLDFSKEVENIINFGERCKCLDYIVVPSVNKNITQENENIIVMSYLRGRTMLDLNNDEKNIYCELLAKFGIKCVFYDGVYHGDLHQGNLIFMKDGDQYKLGIIDFGIIGGITRKQQNDFYEFMKAFYSSQFTQASTLFFNKHVEPSCTEIKLKMGDEERIVDKISKILERIINVNKQVLPNDMYEINQILYGYNLKIAKYFCKVQLAFMINENVCRNLSTKIAFIEYYGSLFINDY
jgi:ubiquinone biosynthesis protein